MMAQALFFIIFFEKDPQLSAVELKHFENDPNILLKMALIFCWKPARNVINMVMSKGDVFLKYIKQKTENIFSYWD